MPDHSFSKEIFLNIQSKPPLMQLKAVNESIVLSSKCLKGKKRGTHEGKVGRKSTEMLCQGCKLEQLL